jgi:hypothetical protein
VDPQACTCTAFKADPRHRPIERPATLQPLPEGTAHRLLRAAERALSVGFSQGTRPGCCPVGTIRRRRGRSSMTTRIGVSVRLV